MLKIHIKDDIEKEFSCIEDRKNYIEEEVEYCKKELHDYLYGRVDSSVVLEKRLEFYEQTNS